MDKLIFDQKEIESVKLASAISNYVSDEDAKIRVKLYTSLGNEAVKNFNEAMIAEKGLSDPEYFRNYINAIINSCDEEHEITARAECFCEDWDQPIKIGSL
ncbi:MAG: hypothetical protein ACOCWM_01490 [Cyclobacteriaceae bacterium]